MAAKLGRLVDIFSLAWDLAITELCSKKLSKLLDCNFTYNKLHLYVYWANYLFFWGFGFFTYKADTIITLEKKVWKMYVWKDVPFSIITLSDDFPQEQEQRKRLPHVFFWRKRNSWEYAVLQTELYTQWMSLIQSSECHPKMDIEVTNYR